MMLRFAPGVLLALAPAVASGQGSAPWVRATAMAVFDVSRADLTPERGPITEGRLEEAVVMLRAGALDGRLAAHATLNLEGATMPDGVLTPGAFGEGFFDRRHPHTYLHEAVVSGILGSREGAVRASLSVGKGFVAFGTDDPMNRPALRFPVNHHYSQVLERAVVIAGLAAGPVIVEGTLFNGDEPERPSQFPKVDRLGDSWAVRVTGRPVGGVEAQASYARVVSPEHRPGAGPTQGKLSASVRLARRARRTDVYALAEWARTTDAGGIFTYHSVLAEVELRVAAHRSYYRFERTDRPEEERLLDPFRSVRPHLDDNILGITRWTIHTVGYGLNLRPLAPLGVEPFAEVAYGVAADAGGGLFRPTEFYGDDTLLALTVGVRVTAGGRHRMGRYGVLADHDSQTH